MAARVRTLPASIAPVLVGTSLALGAGTFHALAFVAALLGAVFIQVGTNLSNDDSDARRGADTEDRLGPVRVTAGGLVPPSQVLLATYVTFGLAVGCGAYLVAVAGPELLAVCAASILAGVLYTGGPRPYGYEGMLAIAFLSAPLPWVFGSMTGWLFLPWLALPLAAGVLRTVRTRADGPALNGALARTGMLQLVFCLLYSAGIVASGGIAP